MLGKESPRGTFEGDRVWGIGCEDTVGTRQAGGGGCESEGKAEGAVRVVPRVSRQSGAKTPSCFPQFYWHSFLSATPGPPVPET